MSVTAAEIRSMKKSLGLWDMVRFAVAWPLLLMAMCIGGRAVAILMMEINMEGDGK